MSENFKNGINNAVISINKPLNALPKFIKNK